MIFLALRNMLAKQSGLEQLGGKNGKEIEKRLAAQRIGGILMLSCFQERVVTDSGTDSLSA